MPACSSRRRAIDLGIRRLRFQPPEPRQFLATLTVSTLVDESDGNFAAGDFSLCEAIEKANLDVTLGRRPRNPYSALAAVAAVKLTGYPRSSYC